MTDLLEAAARKSTAAALPPAAPAALPTVEVTDVDALTRRLGETNGHLTLAEADALCLRLARRHYENFTVASLVLPPLLRRHLSRVYAYCRVVDDLGDESDGDATAALEDWRRQVEAVLLHGAEPRHPVLFAVRETVHARALPLRPFTDLVAANLQDQRVKAYRTWEELLSYCRLSAAPVGRMVLGIAGLRDPRAERLADDVCIGLQLANFAQDVSVDAAKGRCYLIGEEVDALGVRGAIRALSERAAALLASGEQLEGMVAGRLRLQLALYRLGGLAILESIRADGWRSDERRPHVAAAQRLRIAAAAAPQLAQRGPASNGRADAERFCQEMARREAANFYWGFVALPREQRTAIYAVYDFARQVDDEADSPGAFNPRVRLDEQRRRLRRALSGAVEDPVMEVLVHAVRRHAIPVDELEAIISGVERDVSRVRYAGWEELRAYCDLVASTVGRICVRIFGYSDSAALERAGELGEALQLTNILRDVREDAALGRIYLPADELARFGVAEEALLAGRPGPGWDELVAFQVERARGLFACGLRVTDYIPRRAAVCVGTMAGIYRAILEEIAARPSLPLERRVSLSAGRKAAVLARACL